MLEHPGDAIPFFNDHDDLWQFVIGALKDLSDYADMTGQVVVNLVVAGILRDDGIRYVDEGHPTVFLRNLTNVRGADDTTGSERYWST